MLRTGKEHLESLRDGRVVYVGGERIDDVTTHPAFRAAAQTVAGIYDLKADPAHRDSMTYEEDGGRHSIYFLKPKTREDLQKRSDGHRRIAELTYGMFGRSPDHVASFVTGMAMKPDALPKPFAESLGEVVLLVEDFADDATLESMGIDDPFELSGLYEGVPLTERSVDQSGTLPETIRLFRRPILDEWAGSDDTLEHLVAHVLIHEVGHHFGLSDDDMHALEDSVE